MKKRAIILVPGFSKREQFAVRNQLVQALTHYTDGYRTRVSAAATDSDADAVRITVSSRATDYMAELHLYEAFWGDLIPDWSRESPWQRFKRGLILIAYWATGGLVKALFVRHQVPARTLFGLTFFALMMILWYLTVINVLALALQETDVTIEDWARPVLGWVPYFDQMVAFFAKISDYSLYVFVIGLFGLGRLEGAANISTFLRAYLRDDPLGEDSIGIRAKTRHRVIDTLDRVYDQDRAFDEIHVVAHSLGGPIAVDALAESGVDLSRTTLHTWGTLLGLLAQQEELIEMEIAKVYQSPIKLNNWIDLMFRADWLASPRPLPRLYENGKPQSDRAAQLFPETIMPKMPRSSLARSGIHQSYYRCETAMLMLVAPQDSLPQPATDSASSAVP